MTLEELEIVVKADITDVTSKLNQLKAQLQDKVQANVQKAVAQVRPEIQRISTSVTSTTAVATKQMEILNRQIDIQAQKVKKLKQAYAEEVKYAKAISTGKINNAIDPDVAGARTKYQQAEIQLEKMQLRASQLANKYVEIGNKSQEAGEKVSKSMKKQRNEIQKTEKHTSKLLQTFKRIAKMMIIRGIIRGIISSAREGIQNLAMANEEFNKSMSEMQASILQAKNSIATAFAPVLEALAPIIVKIAEGITWLFTQLSMWFSAFAGKSEYLVAKKVTTDYAVSLGKATNEQKKANAEQKKMLAGFDELNVLMEKSTAGLNATGLPTADEMFESVKIPDDVMQKATAIREEFEKILPLLEAIGIAIAGYKIGELFGLWGKGTGLVNKLTDAFTGKNKALGDQQGEYVKEYSWLKDLVPKFLTCAIAVGVLGSALSDIKLELPSLEPLKEFQKAFETAKTFIKEQLQGIQDALDGTKNFLLEKIVEIQTAWEDFKTKVSNAWSSLKESVINYATSMMTGVLGAYNTYISPIVDKVSTWIEEMATKMSNGFSSMQKGAETMSQNIQKSFGNFVLNTAKNIQTWVNQIIIPAIEVMQAMNDAGGESFFSLGGVKKAVKSVTKSVTGISLDSVTKNTNIASLTSQVWGNIGSELQRRYSVAEKLDLLPDWKAVGQTIVGGIAVGSGLGALYSTATGDTSLWQNLVELAKTYVPALATGGVVSKPTLALVGESSTTAPEIVAPQKLLLETGQQANIPVMNAIEEMGDKLVTALNSIGVYAEFDYSKLKVGLDNENYRVGGKLYGI